MVMRAWEMMMLMKKAEESRKKLEWVSYIFTRFFFV